MMCCWESGFSDPLSIILLKLAKNQEVNVDGVPGMLSQTMGSKIKMKENG